MFCVLGTLPVLGLWLNLDHLWVFPPLRFQSESALQKVRNTWWTAHHAPSTHTGALPRLVSESTYES